jgi:hypothetical protein
MSETCTFNGAGTFDLKTFDRSDLGSNQGFGIIFGLVMMRCYRED